MISDRRIKVHMFKGLHNPDDQYIDLRGKGFEVSISVDHIISVEKYRMYDYNKQETIEYGTMIEMITGRLLHIYETYDEVMAML